MENTLIIGFSAFPVVTTKLDEFLLVFSFLDVFFQLLQIERIIQETIMLIPLVDDTTPAGPSPNGKCRTEEIVIRHVWGNFVVVNSRNHADAAIVFISVEQFLAESKEADGRYIIVFKYDAFLDNRKSPFLGKIFRRVTTKILFLVPLIYFTFPVYLIYYLPAS